MSAAWVSRERPDAKELDRRGKPKRRREKTKPGVAGVKDADCFLVQWLDPDGRLRQERIKVQGKPGKRLADRRAEQLTAQLTLGEYESKNKATWAAFRGEFEQKWMADNSTGTKSRYSESLDLFEQICKPKLMRSITTKTVADFRAGLRRRRGKKRGSMNSPANVNKHLRHLRVALRRAHKWDYLEKLPAVEMLREPEKEPVFMQPDHFELIYTAADVAKYPADRPYSAGDWWRALMLSGLMTGMRINEMLTLPWDDTHLDSGFAVVRHNRAKGKRDDVIPLHPVVVDHIRRITDVGLLVFDWPLGERALLDEWHRIQRAAGIHLDCHEEHEHTPTCHVYGFHSLKKACGTLNAARLPETVLNAFMRHASVETTRKYYQNKERILDGHVDSMYVPEIAKLVR